MTEAPGILQKDQIERIFTFDLVRGGAIIGILVFHRVLWDWFFTTYTGGELPLEIGLLYLFITMAGIFYVITGSVYAFMIHKRLSAGKITEKQVILGGWVNGLLLIAYSYVMRIFLIRFLDDTMPLVILDPTLQNGTGILPYLILHGVLPNPLVLPGQWLGLETLAMIGWTIIFVSTILGFASKWRDLDNPRFIYPLLALIGAAVLIITPIIRTAVGGAVETAAHNGEYLLAFFTMPFTYGMMPLFPHLAYGCFGAMLGTAIARREDRRKLLLLILLFAFVLLILGFPNSGSYQGLPGQEPYGWIDSLNLMARKLVQLGFFFLLFFIGLALVDYRPVEIRNKWARRGRPIILFGKLALSVYMLEGLMAVILQQPVSFIWPGWNASFLSIVIFGFFNVLVWYAILRIWQRHQFKGSLEWALVWMVQNISGKKSSRFRD
ncbi:MAG: hypothetical protein ACFFEA_08010 [Candidatus Thorarchaeota archaeon]